jgi:hypothetical protein
MSRQPEIGSGRPTLDAPVPQFEPVALVQLIATLTLALSTLIVAIVVTLGLARVDIPKTGADAAPFAITGSPTNHAA